MKPFTHKIFFETLLFSLAITVCLFMASCESTPSQEPDALQKSQEPRLQIVATLFPQYDFARQIAGDLADVTLLLPPGAESHSYEPSPSDILAINRGDVFLYTGEQMEIWASRLLKGLQPPGPLVVDVSQGLTLVTSETVLGDDYEDTDHGDAEHEDASIYEPHIWTSPVMAKQMVRNIQEGLSQADPAHSSIYAANADAYIATLEDLDARFRETVAKGNRKDFIFGSRFASYYFAAEYGLAYDSAFDSCSGETEPSARTLARLITHIREVGVPVVFYQELTDEKVAHSVAEATGATPLLFHSCHNVTKEELEGGVTYLSLMEQNIINLKRGLA